jgi:hypothetical protein
MALEKQSIPMFFHKKTKIILASSRKLSLQKDSVENEKDES